MSLFSKISKVLVVSAIVGFITFTTAIPTFAAAKHNVSFIYGTNIYSTSVNDGGTVMPPVDTFVPGYVFAGWVGSSINVKTDTIILGAYVPIAPISVSTPVVNNTSSNKGGQFNEVRFLDTVTNTIYNTQIVEFGKSAKEPELPKHDGYHFARYDGDFICVTDVRTIVAVYHRNNSDCECGMYERIEAQKRAEQERMRIIREQEEAERQAMLRRVEQEIQAEQEMLRQLREKEEAERLAELERQRLEREAEEKMLREL